MKTKKRCLIMYVEEDHVWSLGHHEHGKQCAMLAQRLGDRGFEVQVETSFDPLLDKDLLGSLDLIVPNQTLGHVDVERLRNFTAAVEAGVGLAGFHAGMGDWQRTKEPGRPGYQHMTGGQYVTHYGGTDLNFDVNIVDHEHFITRGMSDFSLQSEQWYMLVDPSNHLLATTPIPVKGADGPHLRNGHIDMPCAWTRYFGKGRVFFTSLGHHVRDLEREDVGGLLMRGLLWAAHAEDARS